MAGQSGRLEGSLKWETEKRKSEGEGAELSLDSIELVLLVEQPRGRLSRMKGPSPHMQAQCCLGALQAPI